ncbi:MAG TPA: 4-(cytidine 5'-diphospho)-2-C-methyl-D-erythritol kinase, partial [Chroococcales cyanobacterium]
MQTQIKDTVATVSPAKLNLTFDIVGGLPDGYHEVVTIMQAIDLEDRLTFHFDAASQFNVELSASYVGNPGRIPLDSSNLIARAARLFHEHVAPERGYLLRVEIEKRIPITAGLGGGSGNAAATLLAMNHYFGQPVPDIDLATLGSKLGADVPFFLDGGTQIGLRRGDILSPTPLGETLHFVVVHPQGIEISTPWIYSAYDEYVKAAGNDDDFEHPDLYECKNALANCDLTQASRIFGNV